MSQVTIDGKEYDFDSLSDTAKGQVISLQFVNAELKRLESKIAVYKTAQSGYLATLKEAIEEK